MLEPNIKGPFWAEPVIEYVSDVTSVDGLEPPPQLVKLRDINKDNSANNFFIRPLG
jgi:hypothetical protein